MNYGGYPEMPEYLPHEQRVIDEKSELSDKVGKLVAFTNTKVFAELDEPNKELLRKQLEAMFTYEMILIDRIVRF
jgi:hypothetical protein